VTTLSDAKKENR